MTSIKGNKMKLFLIFISLFAFCCAEEKDMKSYRTAEITSINLGEKFSNKDLQISGLDWHGNDLILLPQFPADFNFKIFSVSKQDILHYLEGDQKALPVSEISFKENGLRDNILEPEYEAIAFNGDRAYLLTEKENPMESYIVRAAISDGSLNIENNKYSKIPIPFDIFEMGCEALFIAEDTIYVFYEANGVNIFSQPVVFRFDLELNPLSPVSLPNIEFRVTDATQIDTDNSFWIINNFWEGEESKLQPAQDAFIPDVFNNRDHGVKRLIQLKLNAGSISFAGMHPIMLRPENWNWEGLVKLDNKGFLIINDEFSPEPMKTSLGFIPYPK